MKTVFLLSACAGLALATPQTDSDTLGAATAAPAVKGVHSDSATEALSDTEQTAAPTQSGTSPDTLHYDAQGHPYVALDNGVLSVHIYVPGTYYRGSRFDWSGMVGHVAYKDHTFYAPWISPHTPQHPEHGIGPAEEFDMHEPPLFRETGAGEAFMKIGVGMLHKKEAHKKYFFNRPYTIADPGRRSMYWCDTTMTSTHQVQARGYGYTYRKRIVLHGAAMHMEHMLINTGTRPIETLQYCHNFTIIDSTPIGAAYEVRFPFSVDVPEEFARENEAYIACSDSVFAIQKKLGSKALWTRVQGHDGKAENNGATIHNTETGASVTIQGDRPLEKFEFYAVETAICPEPYVKIGCSPGDTAQWRTSYTFSGK